MTTLHMKPRQFEAVKWTGHNRAEVEPLGKDRGPTPQVGETESGVKFKLWRMRPGETPDRTYTLRIWTGEDWLTVDPGWWVVVMESGLARMSPDYVALYCAEKLEPEIAHYYESFKSARDRLERVALGVEKLALEVGTVHGHPNIGRYLQDRIRQLLCTHPASSLRYGAAEVWCSICFARLEGPDMAKRARETMAHIVRWCRCDTSKCAVHHEVKDELPPPTIVVPPIPEAIRAPELLPAGELVQLEPVSEEENCDPV